jgi:hypothetical protein
MWFAQAFRLNTEYLELRPNNQNAQDRQLTLLTDHSMDDELAAAINDYQERDGYDVIVVQASINHLLIVNDPTAMRAFVKTALERVGDSAFVMYQVHRTLLWAGDTDGASKLERIILSSYLLEVSRFMVRLRLACAENRTSDATHIYETILAQHPDISTAWIVRSIMGRPRQPCRSFAAERLLELCILRRPAVPEFVIAIGITGHRTTQTTGNSVSLQDLEVADSQSIESKMYQKRVRSI